MPERRRTGAGRARDEVGQTRRDYRPSESIFENALDARLQKFSAMWVQATALQGIAATFCKRVMKRAFDDATAGTERIQGGAEYPPVEPRMFGICGIPPYRAGRKR
jgi:hypothetical protein